MLIVYTAILLLAHPLLFEYNNDLIYFILVASVGPGLGVIAASYAGCDKVAVATLFTIGMAFMGFFYPSLKVNALDLSPNYAGTLMAIVNGIGAISGIITPALIGALTPNVSIQVYCLLLLYT